LKCLEKENDYTILCVGDFSHLKTGIYIAQSFEYNKTTVAPIKKKK